MRMVNSSSHKPKREIDHRLLGTIAMVAVALVAGFVIGIVYQKGHQKSTTSSTNGFSRSGGFNRANRGVIGTVSAISSSSISVNDERSGSTVTLAITSSTQITDNGQTTSASDIQTGDTVFVTKDSSNASQAARILVNPSFGGGFGGQSGAGSSSSSSD